MNASFRKKLIRKDLLLGTIVTIPSTEIVEILCQAEFDWLFIDLEHSAMSVKDAQRLLQVAGTKTPCLIRVPTNDETWISKAMDIGASGIIVPQTVTPDDVERAVRSCKYPPDGSRSVGIARAQGYGNTFSDYVATANDEIAIVIQIEHLDAVENVEEILKVPGIDCLFVGPYDLSASMGKTGQINDLDVQAAITKVSEAADQAAVPKGIFGATTDAVDPYIQSGYTLIAVGMDAMLIGEAARGIMKVFRTASE